MWYTVAHPLNFDILDGGYSAAPKYYESIQNTMYCGSKARLYLVRLIVCAIYMIQYCHCVNLVSLHRSPHTSLQKKMFRKMFMLRTTTISLHLLLCIQNREWKYYLWIRSIYPFRLLLWELSHFLTFEFVKVNKI